MAEEKTQLKTLLRRLEGVSFPALITDEEGKILHRNRFAKGLLPPLWRLRRFLDGQRLREEGLVSSRLEGRAYFVGRLPYGSYTLFVFLENFLPFHEPFSRYLLRETMEHFRSFRNTVHALEGGKGEEKNFGERLIARTERLRQESGAYYRLVTAKERRSEGKNVCDLPSFFAVLKEEMKSVRMGLELDCPKHLGAEFSPSVLVLVILSIAQFVFLFEGKDTLHLALRKRGGKGEITLTFPDREGLFSTFSQLAQGDEAETVFPKAIGFAPLFCALVLCGKENVKISLFKEGEMGKVRLFLPCTAALPETFLGTKDGKTALMMKELIREVFLAEEEIKS